MKKTLVIILSIIFVVCMLPINAFASTVVSVDVDNIDLPVAGAKPDTSAQLGSLSDVMKIQVEGRFDLFGDCANLDAR